MFHVDLSCELKLQANADRSILIRGYFRQRVLQASLL
jgi:hypothetical protein